MRSKKKNLLWTASIGVLFTLTSLYLSTSPQGPITVARAQTGSLLKTVNLPAGAQCSLGTSVAVVPGLSLGLVQYPILLVTSCYGASGNSLYFLDPSTDPATLVRTVVTTNTPPLGWGSLALRGDKGDLLACGNNSSGEHRIYSINMFNGAATFMFNGTAGLDICDGVAWDAGDNTIFQSPDVSSTIYHFSETGTLLGTLPAPGGCPNSGVAVGGASLFAACNGVLTVHQLNKGTGASIVNFPSSGRRTEDLECDPVSFSADRKDAMWSKDAFTNQIYAFEIPAGTCGFAGGPPPPTLAACSDTDGNGNVDNDGDSLCDNWETTGIDFNGDGTIDFTPPGANLNQPDAYVEVDWMNQHQPRADSINDVIASFAAHGVALHVLIDEEAIPTHNNQFVFEPCTAANAALPNFDTVKNARFGTVAERALPDSVNVLNAKRFVYHYSLYVHNLNGTGSSGCAEIGSNDFVVSLGGWGGGAHPGGTRDHQAGTFMHEFGHNLGLLHGGNAPFDNCKPNYLSVMSYTRQIDGAPIVGRPLDYSNSTLLSLNEANLNDAAGMGGPALTTVYGPQTAVAPPVIAPAQAVFAGGQWLVLTPANQPVDWNKNGDFTSAGVSADINSIPSSGCGGTGQVLTGFNDWANLKYNFRASTDFADGVHLTVVSAPEITLEQGLSISPDNDGDGVVNMLDNCPLISNAGQEDSDGDGVGDVCSQQQPGILIQALIDRLNGAGIKPGILNSLRSKLQNVQKSIDRGQALAACNLMDAFLNEVNAQSGKALSSSLADGLAQDALQIKLALQCGIANGRRAFRSQDARSTRVAMVRPKPRVRLTNKP